MKKHTFPTSKSHQLRAAGSLIFCTLTLSSCGGGGGGEQPAPIIQNEVINGITVPVAPDPVKNSATVQGIDANANLIRDDVERKAAQSATVDTNPKRTAIISKLLQQQIVAGNSSLNQEEC